MHSQGVRSLSQWHGATAIHLTASPCLPFCCLVLIAGASSVNEEQNVQESFLYITWKSGECKETSCPEVVLCPRAPSPGCQRSFAGELRCAGMLCEGAVEACKAVPAGQPCSRFRFSKCKNSIWTSVTLFLQVWLSDLLITGRAREDLQKSLHSLAGFGYFSA